MELIKDFVVVTGLALLFLLVSWVYGRVLSKGGPLNAIKRGILLYAFVFALGMMYLMLLVSDLHWRMEWLFPLIAFWGVLLGLLAWRYHRGKHRRSPKTVISTTDSKEVALQGTPPKTRL